MENKEIKAIVDKQYKLLIIVGFVASVHISLAICNEALKINPNFDVNLWGGALFLILIIAGAMLMDRFLEFQEVLTAKFKEDHVILKRGKKERIIPYHKIKKVVKYMIINRTYQDKGHYRVVIRCKGRNYVMYSGENADLKLDFEQTEVSKIYFEFKHRGIMCC